MCQIDWEHLIPKVCALAREAGKQIMTVYNEASGTLVKYKSDDSPLTEADLAAHACIVEGLAVLTQEIPVVSEESADSLKYGLPDGRYWLIDPLDGTKEFVARNGEFTVNIALIEDGRTVWGVVFAPALEQLYWGGREFGSHKESISKKEEIRVAVLPTQNVFMRVVASKRHLNAQTEAFIRRLGTVSLIQAGSSLKLCRVAEGAADIYPRLAPTCEWDTAAAQAVVEGAGGYVVDESGNPLRYGKPDVRNPSFIAAAVPLEKLAFRD